MVYGRKISLPRQHDLASHGSIVFENRLSKSKPGVDFLLEKGYVCQYRQGANDKWESQAKLSFLDNYR
jgi:hypothetical protein